VIDLTDLEGRMMLHTVRIARSDRMGWPGSRLAAGARARPTVHAAMRRRAGVAPVRVGARLMGARAGIQLGTGRIVRQPGAGSTGFVADGLDHPVRLGFGPDGALYLTYPAVEPGAGGRPGALLRIDVAAG